MSALIAVCKAGCIDVLSDGAATCVTTGRLARLERKQTFLRDARGRLSIVAAIGHTPFSKAFVSLAMGAEDYETLVQAAPAIWREAKAMQPLPALHGQKVGQTIVLAGYSIRHQQMQLWSVNNEDDEFAEDVAISAGGASKSNHAQFTNTFGLNPESFIPERDGLSQMEALRRDGMQLTAGSPRVTIVGGYLQHTRLARDELRSVCVYPWHDEVGQLMNPEAA